jgi:hypothetical protein
MGTVKFSELKTAILESLRPKLVQHGFTLNAQHGRFVRKRGEITDRFTLQCRDGKPGCRVEPDVGVRIEYVEEIYHRTSWFQPKQHKNTSTVGGSIGELSDRPSRRLEFFTEFESGATADRNSGELKKDRLSKLPRFFSQEAFMVRSAIVLFSLEPCCARSSKTPSSLPPGLSHQQYHMLF